MSRQFLDLLPDALAFPLLRRAARLHAVSTDKYSVRLATTAQEHRDAYALVHTAYAYQGIELVTANPLRVTPQHLLPEANVLVAYEGEVLVGTMTVFHDSPAGLPLDKDYGQQIDLLRAQGHTLVEYGALAVVERCWHTGVTTLLNIAAHWLSVNLLQASHCVIGVHPKAARWYQAIYKFERLGQAQAHAQLRAPVIGLKQDLAQSQRHLDRCYRKQMENGIRLCDAFQHLGIACVQLPRQLNARHKLSREVFQELFIERSDQLARLDPVTRAYLEEWRTPETLVERPARVSSAA